MGLEGSSAFGAPVQKVQRVQRVVVGALMGASINALLRQQENKTTALTGEEMQSPFGAVRHQRGKSHRRWLITVMLFMTYDTEK